MPIPVKLKQQREADYRINFINRLANLAVDEVVSITQEVLGVELDAKNFSVAAFHNYCNHLITDKVNIDEGKYEPHAMYMRVYLRELMLKMKFMFQIIPRPHQIIEVPSHE
jgi:hypothetical protein